MMGVDLQQRAAELTVVVPTLNERDNIARLVGLLDRVLAEIAWEVIFVDDDSQDGTADRVGAIARRDPRVRCLRRIGRRGLSSACIEGVLASTAPYVVIMDADLQHDESLLPRMFAALKRDECDIVVGSRYALGGEIGDWSGTRARISRWATRFSRLIYKGEIGDPMSGFFMLRRDVFDRSVRRLSGQGFKLLVDLLASAPEPIRIVELPYRFRTRQSGESKLDTLVIWEFLVLIADKLVGRFIPVRFALFAAIGLLGLAVHFVVLWSTFAVLRVEFLIAQTAATVIAMTSNFFFNNLFTYRDKRLKGRGLIRGLLSFYVICSIGAVANVGIAAYLFAADRPWWIAGIAGIVVGSVWNYAASSTFTWRPN